jgi:FKBP-type peptidyl-prolyl cis-trans isomerase (trigger factor)
MSSSTPHKHFQKLKVDELPGSETLITGEITLPFLVVCRIEALKKFSTSVNIPGFRKGHIPEEILVKNIGEMRILEESAEIALAREYEHIVKEAKLSVIGRPEISITKIAPGIPLEFKIRVYLEPKFELPNYKKIANEFKMESPVTNNLDSEINDVIEELEKPEIKEGEDLRTKIKENLTREKERRAKENKRLKIIESLVKATNVTIPKILIESELIKMIAQFKDDIAKANVKWEDYLLEIKKSEEDIKNEWRDKALDRVKADLIISKIADTEKIEPDKKDVEHEVKHLLSHHPNADPLRAHLYVYSILSNQKVFEFLENL